MVIFVIPFLSVFAEYVLPLNLNVNFLPLIGFLPFKVAFITNFLADFLTVTFASFKSYFTLTAFSIVWPA